MRLLSPFPLSSPARLPSAPMAMRVAVALSGRGSNLDALLRALPPGGAGRGRAGLSDRAGAGGLAIARGRAGSHPWCLADPADPSAWLDALRSAPPICSCSPAT